MCIFFRAHPREADRRSAGTVAIVAAVAGLALGAQVTEAGLVGEVAVTWSPARPTALVALDPPVDAGRSAAGGEAAVHLGPLRWGPTRPTLRLGPMPLLVNAYTGALPDVPSWIAARMGATEGQLATAMRTGSAGLVLLLATLLMRAGAPLAAAAAAILLAFRWDVHAYRALLGGTELALQLAVAMLCMGMCSSGTAARRWIGAALALGLHAKITFALSAMGLLAGGVVAGALPRSWARAAAWGAALGLFPAGVGLLLELGPGASLPSIPSHDRIAGQLGRVAAALGGEGEGPRQGGEALLAWFTEPTAFVAAAYRSPASTAAGPAAAALGALGWALAAAAALTAPSGAAGTAARLRRALQLGLPLQIGLLWFVARDLHHLAQAALPAAAWMGLSFAALATRAGAARWLVLVALCAPLSLSGALALRHTDAVLIAARAPTVSASGQRAIAALVKLAGSTPIWVCDYEAWGSIDRAAPAADLRHAWPALARGTPAAPEQLLRAAAGGHLLTLRSSAPYIYNWSPDAYTLERTARAAGVEVRELGRLPDGAAVLWAVDPAGL